MSAIENAIWNHRISRKLDKVNRALAEQEAREWTDAMAAMVRCARETAREVRAMDKALQQAMRRA